MKHKFLISKVNLFSKFAFIQVPMMENLSEVAQRLDTESNNNLHQLADSLSDIVLNLCKQYNCHIEQWGLYDHNKFSQDQLNDHTPEDEFATFSLLLSGDAVNKVYVKIISECKKQLGLTNFDVQHNHLVLDFPILLTYNDTSSNNFEEFEEETI